MVQERAGCKEGKTRATLFVQTLVTLRNELYAYVASFGSISKVMLGATMSSMVLDAINENLAKTTEYIRDLAAMLNMYLSNGPRLVGQFGSTTKME